MNQHARSQALLARAQAVIPGGIWGHNRFPAFLDPGAYPYFADHGRGCRFVDVDGREYSDYLCGYGAMINGYAEPRIDEAAQREHARGGCLAQPTERTIELAERLCGLVADADWCAFAKNGSDATWIAFLVARAHTGRSHIVCARGAYHGSHLWCDWCNPGGGRQPERTDLVLGVDWNDAESLESLFVERGETIAAVMFTPYHHPIGSPAELPAPGFWRRARELCSQYGAALVVDDVRAGFRLDLHGSHAYFGFQADLVCFSKAIANTHPLAAVTGAAVWRDAAASVFAAGTFWSSGSAMAAALVNLDLLEERDACAHMDRLGRQLADGLRTLGAHHAVALEVTGPPAMPTVLVDGDREGRQMMAFARAMAQQGSFVHPAHNWFLSAAHTSDEIERTLEHADHALAQVETVA